VGSEVNDGEVKDLLARETIILVFSVASAIIVAKLMGHDVLKPLRMRSLIAAKRFGQSQADAWQTFADTAATSYHKAHL
jgi:hypothetical protein